MATLPHSSYIEDCCRSLRDAAEFPTDKYLLYIVRLQHILEKIDHLSIHKGANMDVPESAVEAYVWALKSELDVFRQRLPFAMNGSCGYSRYQGRQLILYADYSINRYPVLLVTQYYTVELFLYQLSLLDPNSEPDPTRPFPWRPWRLEMLCAGLISARSMLSSFLSLPLDAGRALNNSQWVQIGFALTVASKLSIAATDKAVAIETLSYRQSLGISHLLTQCILRTGSLVTDFVDEDGERDVFYHYQQRAKRIQTWYESNIALENSVDAISNPSSPHIMPYLPMAQESNGFTNDWQGYPNRENSAPNETYSLEMPHYLPDATIDEIMGDWMSYPTNQS